MEVALAVHAVDLHRRLGTADRTQVFIEGHPAVERVGLVVVRDDLVDHRRQSSDPSLGVIVGVIVSDQVRSLSGIGARSAVVGRAGRQKLKVRELAASRLAGAALRIVVAQAIWTRQRMTGARTR